MRPKLLEWSTSGELPDKSQWLKKKKSWRGLRTEADAHREVKVTGHGGNTRKAEVSREKWPRSAREGESPGDQNRSRKSDRK